MEVDDEESYGWCPARTPLGLAGVVRGTTGVLNGLGVTPEATPTRDPDPGLFAGYQFHPVLIHEYRNAHDQPRPGFRHPQPSTQQRRAGHQEEQGQRGDAVRCSTFRRRPSPVLLHRAHPPVGHPVHPVHLAHPVAHPVYLGSQLR